MLLTEVLHHQFHALTCKHDQLQGSLCVLQALLDGQLQVDPAVSRILLEDSHMPMPIGWRHCDVLW
jgi:hypothetical protein